jgi:hypothetical protein
MAQDNEQDITAEQKSPGILNDPHSRRKFLRAAVVGTAGVAGAAGVAGVVLARNGGGSPSLLRPFVGGAQVSIHPSCCAGLEKTALTGGCESTYKFNESFYIVYTGKNLPAGDYSFDVTQQYKANAAGSIQPQHTDNHALPWDYQSNGNNVHVDVITANTGTCCPNTGGALGTGHDFLPVTFHLGASSDVYIFVHIQWGSSAAPAKGDTTVFTCTLTGSNGGASCPSTVNVTAS